MLLVIDMSATSIMQQQGSVSMSTDNITTKGYADVSGLYCHLRHCVDLPFSHSPYYPLHSGQMAMTLI